MLTRVSPDSASVSSTSAAMDTVVLVLLAFGVIVLSVSPFLLIEFGHHDDWNLFYEGFRNNRWAVESANGRPGFALILNAVAFPIVHSLPNLLYGRLIAIATLALTFGALAAFLRRYQLSTLIAFCIGAMIFVLPGMQQRVAHVMALPAVIGNLIAMLAGIAMVSRAPGARAWRGCGRKEIAALGAIALSLMATFVTYQACAMLFLLPVLCDALFAARPLRTRIFDAVVRTIFLFAVLALCFVAYKFVALPFASRWEPSVVEPLLPPIPTPSFTGDSAQGLAPVRVLDSGRGAPVGSSSGRLPPGSSPLF